MCFGVLYVLLSVFYRLFYSEICYGLLNHRYLGLCPNLHLMWRQLIASFALLHSDGIQFSLFGMSSFNNLKGAERYYFVYILCTVSQRTQTYICIASRTFLFYLVRKQTSQKQLAKGIRLMRAIVLNFMHNNLLCQSHYLTETSTATTLASWVSPCKTRQLLKFQLDQLQFSGFYRKHL